MPLPSRIKIDDLIIGAALGQDGVYRFDEGSYIGLSLNISGLNPLVQYGSSVFSRDELKISISIKSRQSDAESVRSDFALEDILYQSYSPSSSPFYTWSWFSKSGNLADTQEALLDRKIYAVSDLKTEEVESFDIAITYSLVTENASGKTTYTQESLLSIEVGDSSRLQIAIGDVDDNVINFSDFKYGSYRDQVGQLNYIASYYQSTGTPVVTDYSVYALGGLGADLYVYNASTDVYSGAKSISLGENLALKSPGLKGSSLADAQLYSSAGDDIWGDDFVAVYAFYHTIMVGEGASYTTSLMFPVKGKQRFFDVIQSDSSSDLIKPLNVYLSNNQSGDAFFLHDTFSAYNKSLVLGSDALGRPYTPRILGVDRLFAGEGNDIVDLTTTESTAQFICNRVDLGAGDDVLMGKFNFADGGDGDDLIISSGTQSVVTGGAGRDTFAYVHWRDPRGSLNAAIRDFDSGVDRIKLYVDSAYIDKARNNGGYDLLASERVQRLANGDLSWTYSKYAETWAGVTTLYESKRTISLGGATWSFDDIELVPYISVPC
jgi:hypothetical protein